jgi:hypothetical protein
VSSVLADAEPFVGSVEGSLGSRAGG